MESVFVDRTAKCHVSYLRARDPSIVTCGRSGLNPETLFCESPNLTEDITRDEEEDSAHLNVYLRMKNTDNYTTELYEISDEKTLLCKVPPIACGSKDISKSSSVTKLFTFSKIFGPDAMQLEIFNDVVKTKVLHFINGYNCSLLTYGASGSGKTYTLVGTIDEPGILPRSLEYLFRTLPKLSEEPRFKPDPLGGITRLSESIRKRERFVTQKLLEDSNSGEPSGHVGAYRSMQQQLINEAAAKVANNITEDVNLSVWVSFAEIYNECIYDLVIPEPPHGKPKQKLQLGKCHENAYIKDLTYINVRSSIEAYQILQHGLHNLRYAATSVNERSSRSHSIFTIMLVQASDIKDGYNISAFNLCDLAGSERLKKTQNVGDRLKESKNINTSLMVLGRCLTLIRQCQKGKAANKLIPFRDSKLTRLFERALLGHERIFMIVNINTNKDMFDESHHVLNFSAIAKDVNVVELPPLPCNRFSGYMEQKLGKTQPIIEQEDQDIVEILLLEIHQLKNQLETQKLESKEDRDYVINTYKNLLKETTEFWENRYNKSEERFRQYRYAAYAKAANNAASSSVICLDTSSSSDEENTEHSLTKAQKEISELRQQLQEKDEVVKTQVEEISTLKEMVDDAANINKELGIRSTQMKRQLILQDEQITVLQTQVDCYSMFEHHTDDFLE